MNVPTQAFYIIMNPKGLDLLEFRFTKNMLGSRIAKLVFFLGNILGFPIHLKWDESLNMLQFQRLGSWSTLFRLSSCSWSLLGIIFLFGTKGNVLTLFNFFAERGFSILDLSSTWILWFLAMSQAIFIWIFYRKNMTRINEIIFKVEYLMGIFVQKGRYRHSKSTDTSANNVGHFFRSKAFSHKESSVNCPMDFPLYMCSNWHLFSTSFVSNSATMWMGFSIDVLHLIWADPLIQWVLFP